MVFCEEVLEVASPCLGLGVRAKNGVAKHFRLVLIQGAKWGVISIRPGGGGQPGSYSERVSGRCGLP